MKVLRSCLVTECSATSGWIGGLRPGRLRRPWVPSRKRRQ
jgi:hypothetical protein